MPNFLILGAGKAGTTALFSYLRQHPRVFLPERKEMRFLSGMKPNFQGPRAEGFNASIITSVEEYKRFFANVDGADRVGDISPDYLYYHESTIRNIKRYFDDPPKMIIVLRSPITRAFSHYCMVLRDGSEPLSFEAALEAEPERIAQNWDILWHYGSLGYYYQSVSRFKAEFGDRLLILIYEDYPDISLALPQICDFLGIDSSFPFVVRARFNISGVPRSRFIYDLSHRPFPGKDLIKLAVPRTMRERCRSFFDRRMLVRLKMPEEVRAQLRERYRDDVGAVSELLRRDLGFWLR